MKKEEIPETYAWAVKDTRADLRYQPLCKPIIDVMCLPNIKNQEEIKIFQKILDNYLYDL